MAISYFTRVCASFLPSVFLPGKSVYVSRFPSFLDRYSGFIDILVNEYLEDSLFNWNSFSDKPGWYVVDSVISHSNGVTEIGLEIDDDIQYYAFSDIEITAIEPSER